VKICCVFVADISFDIKTEADSSDDITDYQHDDMPSTGMIVLQYECILCTTFALMFMLFCYVHQQKYVSLFICPKVLLESHPEHRPSLHVYLSFRQYQIIRLIVLLISTVICTCLLYCSRANKMMMMMMIILLC